MFTTLTSNEYNPQKEFERAVLGIILDAPSRGQANITLNVCASLNSECFTIPIHRKLFKIITDYTAKNGYKTLGFLSLCDFYLGENNQKQKKDVKTAGLLAELAEAAEIQDETVTVRNWKYWVEKLHKSYEKRLIKSCGTLRDTDRAKEILSSLQIKENFNALIDAQNEYIETYDNARENLLKTYYSSLDAELGGFATSNLIIIGARPAMGKTVTALNIAGNLARHNKSSLFIELEMTPDEIMQRINSNILSIPAKKLRDRNLSEDEICRLQNYQISEKGKKFYSLINMPAKCKPDITTIENIIRNSKEDVIFIDHIGLIRDNTKNTRYENVSEIVERLKTLALEIEKPIIALCQLSRAPVNREDTRPRLSDLRESGALEQSADTVLFVHRESYYNPSLPDNKLELIIGKSRSTGGAGKIISLIYSGDYQRITDPLGETKEEYKQCKII